MQDSSSQMSQMVSDADLSLAAFHDDEFLLRGRSGEDDLGVVLQHVVEQLGGHFFQLAAVDDAGLRIPGEETRAVLGQLWRSHILFLRGNAEGGVCNQGPRENHDENDGFVSKNLHSLHTFLTFHLSRGV